jgi:hypothetical protein
VTRCCPYCNQTLPEIRLGVRLTPLKARIFDLVQRGGRDGIDRADLFDIIFGDGEHSRETLKAHIFRRRPTVQSHRRLLRRQFAR